MSICSKPRAEEREALRLDIDLAPEDETGADSMIGVDRRRQPGLLRGQVGEAFFEPLPEEEIDAWES